MVLIILYVKLIKISDNYDVIKYFFIYKVGSKNSLKFVISISPVAREISKAMISK